MFSLARCVLFTHLRDTAIYLGHINVTNAFAYRSFKMFLWMFPSQVGVSSKPGLFSQVREIYAWTHLHLMCGLSSSDPLLCFGICFWCRFWQSDRHFRPMHAQRHVNARVKRNLGYGYKQFAVVFRQKCKPLGTHWSWSHRHFCLEQNTTQHSSQLTAVNLKNRSPFIDTQVYWPDMALLLAAPGDAKRTTPRQLTLLHC